MQVKSAYIAYIGKVGIAKRNAKFNRIKATRLCAIYSCNIISYFSSFEQLIRLIVFGKRYFAIPTARYSHLVRIDECRKDEKEKKTFIELFK